MKYVQYYVNSASGGLKETVNLKCVLVCGNTFLLPIVCKMMSSRRHAGRNTNQLEREVGSNSVHKENNN